MNTDEIAKAARYLSNCRDNYRQALDRARQDLGLVVESLTMEVGHLESLESVTNREHSERIRDEIGLARRRIDVLSGMLDEPVKP